MHGRKNKKKRALKLVDEIILNNTMMHGRKNIKKHERIL